MGGGGWSVEEGRTTDFCKIRAALRPESPPPPSFLPHRSGWVAPSQGPALLLQSKRLPRPGNFPSSCPELSSLCVKDVPEFANVEMMGACFFD